VTFESLIGRLRYAVFLLVVMCFVTIAHAQSLVIEGMRGWLYPGWESLTDENRTGLDQTLKLISEAQAALSAANIKLCVLVVPMKATIYPEYLPADQKLSDAVRNRYAHILQTLEKYHVPTLDLKPLLLGVKAQRLAFYRTDYHWTPWSSEAAARGMAKLISPEGLAQKHPGGKAEQWRKEKRYGDLASFLPRERRKSIGEEDFAVRVENKKGGLLDESHAVVAVVGNSFVQPSLGFPQALGATFGRQVGLSWNYGAVGPWVTLLQYLESEGFKRSHPQVILWQWNEAQVENGPGASGQWAKESIMSPPVWLNRLRYALSQ
jgi:alginate O-acetyltransferase complex protein AlgJ